MIHGVLAGTEPGNAAYHQFDASVADKVLEVVKDSFVAGVQLSLRVVAAIALVGLVIAIRGVRVPPAQRNPPDPARLEVLPLLAAELGLRARRRRPTRA